MENKKTNIIKKKLWFIVFGAAFLVANGIAVALTTKWEANQWGGLLLGNIIFLITVFYLVGIFKLTKRLFSTDYSVSSMRPTQAIESVDKRTVVDSSVSILTENKVDKFYRISFLGMAVITFVLPFLFMIHVPDSPHAWDYFVIFNSTTELQGHSFASLPNTASRLGYFLRYPNNQFLGILFNRFFAPFADNLQLKVWAVTAVSALFTSVGISSTSLLVKSLSGKRQALLYNFVAVGFIPFYFYGAQLYSDTLTLPLVALAALFFIYAVKSSRLSKQILWYFFASLIGVIGYEFKPTAVIVIIAGFFFLAVNKKWKQLLIVLPLFIVLFAGGHELVKTTIASEPAFSEQANERHNLPLMHWIAMSWSPTNKTGGFNKKIRLYSESFPTYEAKKEADTQLFLNNIKKMGPIGIIRQIGRKLGYTWTFSDLNSSYYTYYHENQIVHRYFDYLDIGANHEGNVTGWFMLKAAQTLYWIALVVLMWKEIWSLLAHKKNWKNPWFVPALSVVGLSIFLILWEANSRYLYHFAPLMIALATVNLVKIVSKSKAPNNIPTEN